jgi:hypothetical protein
MVVAITRRAQEAALFRPLPMGRCKGVGIHLFEACSVPEWRPMAIQAMAWAGTDAVDSADILTSALVDCGAHLQGAELRTDHTQWLEGAGAPPPSEEETHWLRDMVRAHTQLRPERYTPARTSASRPDAHPWMGYLGTVSFGELAAGAGFFAAHFRAAGAECAYVVEPRPDVLQRAVANAGGTATTFGSVLDVDPAELPWVHVLVGGAE